jgi:hypothetical protein
MNVKLISQLVVEHENVVVLDGTNVQALIDDLNTAKRLRKTAEEQEAAAKAAIKALLGDAREGVVDGVVKVELVEKSRKGVDTELLEKAYPEAYAACGKVTLYDELRTH